MEREDRKKDFLLKFLYFAVIFGLFFIFYKYLLIYIMPFLVGGFLALVVQKPAQKISRKHKRLVAGILVVGLFLILLGVFFVGCSAVYKNSEKIISMLRSTAQYFVGIIEMVINKFSLTIDADTFINSFFDNFGQTASSAVGGVAKGLPKIVFSLVITVVATCYFAIDYDKFVKFFKGFFSEKTVNIISASKRIVTTNLYKIVKGYFFLTLITFGQLLIGFFVLGIKSPILLATLVALIDLLPVLGTGLVLLPWAIILFFNGSYFVGMGLVALYLIIIFVRNFLEPKIVGQQIGIPPIVNLLILFFGLKLFGFIGMIFLVITLVVIVNLYKEKLISV